MSKMINKSGKPKAVAMKIFQNSEKTYRSSGLTRLTMRWVEDWERCAAGALASA